MSGKGREGIARLTLKERVEAKREMAWRVPGYLNDEDKGAQQVASAVGAQVRVSFWAGQVPPALGPVGAMTTA